MTVRVATVEDLDAIVARSSVLRDQLQDLEPTFWRRHPDADANQRAWLAVLLEDPSHHVLVSATLGEVNGFVVARAADAPPVYDPGGRTCLVDDFVWDTMETAETLLAAVRRWAASIACTQLVVVTAAADDERRALLDHCRLHPTSEWWTGPV